MVVVRLARKGAKDHPFYHVVVTDSRKPRDSGLIEKIGYFNPFAKKNETSIQLNEERLKHWRALGAQPSDRVVRLAREYLRLNSGKSEEEGESQAGEKEAETEKQTEAENDRSPIASADAAGGKERKAETETGEAAGSQAETELADVSREKEPDHSDQEKSAEKEPEPEADKKAAPAKENQPD